MPSDPVWVACDRLDAKRGIPRAGGVWAEAWLTSWEAVPDALESRARAGWEPFCGPGVRAEYASLRWPDGALLDVGAGLVWRGSTWRNELAVAQSRSAGHHALRTSERFLIAISPHVVTGGSVTVFPGASRGSPEFGIETHASAGPWLLGLLLDDGGPEASVGIEVRSHLVLLLRYRNESPGMGFVLETSTFALRGEALDHPHLGRIARVSLRWSRGGR